MRRCVGEEEVRSVRSVVKKGCSHYSQLLALVSMLCMEVTMTT